MGGYLPSACMPAADYQGMAAHEANQEDLLEGRACPCRILPVNQPRKRHIRDLVMVLC